jgi:hypothetical protein
LTKQGSVLLAEFPQDHLLDGVQALAILLQAAPERVRHGTLDQSIGTIRRQEPFEGMFGQVDQKAVILKINLGKALGVQALRVHPDLR